MLRLDVHGCTDVTGFGLIGHAREMALASGVTLEIDRPAGPFPARRAGYARAGAIPGGLKNNREFACVRGGEHPRSAAEIEDLLYDPQTSGGLLIALPETDAAALERCPRRARSHRPRAGGAEKPIRSYEPQPHHRRAGRGIRGGRARPGPLASAPRSIFTRSAWNCTPPPAWPSCANCSIGGKEVFLDLKFYDIPETVRRAVAQVARTGVRFLTVHAVVGDARGRGGQGRIARSRLLAVTVLTSFGQEDLATWATPVPVSELVATRARKAMDAGRRRHGRLAARSGRRPRASRGHGRFWSRPACARPAPRTATRSASRRPPKPFATAPITW